MRYLNDSYILKWNTRFDSINILPRYDNSFPKIIIQKEIICPFDLSNIPSNNYNKKVNLYQNYKFTFSISERLIKDFENILKILKKEKTLNEFESVITDNYGTSNLENFKIDKLEIDDVIISEEWHTFSGEKFKRFEYDLYGTIPSIMIYVSYIEDTIIFLKKLWNYDENKKEIFNLKFKKYDIVSLKENKSLDYLIIDYDYKIINSEKYIIDYKTIKIKDNIKHPIIDYENIITFKEEELCNSRNNIIDNVLKK